MILFLVYTVDQKIFDARKFSSVGLAGENFEFTSMRNDHYRRWQTSKINRSENLKDELFREQKYPDLRYTDNKITCMQLV